MDVNKRDRMDSWYDDILLEVFRHLDAKSLAIAACVNKQWKECAEFDSLWENICSQNWPIARDHSHSQQLRSVVLALGGYRRFFLLCLRPLVSRQLNNSTDLPCGFNKHPWSKDEIHLSLSLFSIDCYERLGKQMKLEDIQCRQSCRVLELG
eukprot:Gb_08963 [translate_table: standard]